MAESIPLAIPFPLPSSPGPAAPKSGADEGASEDRTPVDRIVERIHAGSLAAESLPAEVRRRCVSQLTAEGFSGTEIAALLHMGERTVRRDRAALRKEEALAPSRFLGDELLGEFQRIALASVQRLTRMAHANDVPPYARLWAEEAMNRIYQRFLETTHRLDYFYGGRARLHHEWYCDPQEIERSRKEREAMRQRMFHP